MNLSEKLRAQAEHWSGVDTDRRKLLILAGEAEALERDVKEAREELSEVVSDSTLRGQPLLRCSPDLPVYVRASEFVLRYYGGDEADLEHAINAAIDRERGND